MGSTTVQGSPGRAWPISGPFPWNLAAMWSLLLPDCDIQFWKAFDKVTKIVWADFDFRPMPGLPGFGGGGETLTMVIL